MSEMRQASPSGPGSNGGLEGALARILQAGTYAAVGLVLVGVLLLLARGESPLDHGPGFDLAAIPGWIGTLQPAGFLWLGILGVIATPGVRVLAALVGFIRAGERGMAAVALLVLVVVTLGVIAGVLTG